MNKTIRVKKHTRVRKHLAGTSESPRLSVFKSGKHIYAQLIDDTKHKTLAFCSDLKIKSGLKQDKAYQVGKQLAEKALKLKIKKIVFDRGGFLYHGRIAMVGKGAREGGLEF